MKITHCKLKKKVQKELLRFFVLEVTARSAADILGIHPNSAALFYRKIRTVINHHLALAADEVFEGSVEPDESDFGGRRKGRRGRGAAGKVVVFGILKRNGRVYTVVVNNAKSETLLPVIKKKIMPDSIVYTDSLSSCDKLDVSGFLSITASTIPRNLQTVRTTLTALRTFGIRQNASCENTTESIVNLSRCS
ncbi:IS1016 transposase [Neisseria meningitidis]|nr:IS1016 transposase [Neisseria meningitidis]SUA40205.1 IS1016 transposase [Neisseria meningitidis]